MHLSVDKDLVVQKDVWTISGGVYTKFMAPGGAHYPSGFVNTPDGVSPRPAESPLLEPLLMIYRPFDPTVGGFVDLADRFHLVEGRYVAQGRECVLLVENKNPDITTSLFLDPERDFVVMAMMRQHQGAELYRLAFDSAGPPKRRWRHGASQATVLVPRLCLATHCRRGSASIFWQACGPREPIQTAKMSTAPSAIFHAKRGRISLKDRLARKMDSSGFQRWKCCHAWCKIRPCHALCSRRPTREPQYRRPGAATKYATDSYVRLLARG